MCVKIAELFYSIQGEGKLVGVPSVFVRASGCNLRCSWCDTPYASWEPQGEERSVGEVAEEVGKYPARHVVITGGEPMIMGEVGELCAALKARDFHITIETAATVFSEVKVDLASLSPKLSNSTPWTREGGRFARAHEESRLKVEVIQRFIDGSADFQLKFVVCEPGDLKEIRELLSKLRNWSAGDVMLMPEGTDQGTLNERAGWIGEVCKAEGYRFCPRLHILMYGNRRGT